MPNEHARDDAQPDDVRSRSLLPALLKAKSASEVEDLLQAARERRWDRQPHGIGLLRRAFPWLAGAALVTLTATMAMRAIAERLIGWIGG